MKKISTYIIILTILVFPLFVSAQCPPTCPTVGNPPPNPTVGNPTNLTVTIPNPTTAGSDLISLLVALLNNVVMPIAAVFVTMWIIYAGFKYVTAQGNPEKIKKAHDTLLWSLIGAGILLGAAGISLVVQTTIDALIK